LSIDELHFVVKALGDALVAGEAPHGEDLLASGCESLTELHGLGQAGVAQLVQGTQEPRDQNFPLPTGAMFLQQQIAEPLLEAVDEFQGWVFFQIGGEPKQLIGAQIMAVAAHQQQQTAILAGDGIYVAPASQEVMIDDADDMKAVGHDAQMALDRLARYGGQGRKRECWSHADSQHIDLCPCWSSKFNGASDVRRHRKLARENKCRVTVGGQSNRSGANLIAGLGVVKRNHVSVRSTAFKRCNRLLAAGKIFEDHIAAHLPIGCQLHRTGRHWICT
jgi:hypothetical protein